MRCAEAGAAALLAVALVGVLRSDGAVLKSVHEASLEAGLRVVVAAGGGSEVAAALSIPVGYANDSEDAGDGLAPFMAGYATFELPRWSCAIGPESTLFHATLAADQVEAGLSELAKRLVGEGVEEDRFGRYLDARKALPADAADRLREAAFPESRDGGPISDATRRTKEQLKSFLAERVGSEGSVVALVGPGTPAALELAATRAFASLPRAKGVAPRPEHEPMPLVARKVAAPAGAIGGLVGLRLPWRRDERGDGAALAIAWLETTLGRDAAQRIVSSQGTLVGFAADSGEFADVASKLDAAVARGAKGLDAAAVEAALAHLEKRAEATTQNPVDLAVLLAADGAACSDPLATLSRQERLKERAGKGALQIDLGGWLIPAGRIDVVPAAKRPDGT